MVRQFGPAPIHRRWACPRPRPRRAAQPGHARGPVGCRPGQDPGGPASLASTVSSLTLAADRYTATPSSWTSAGGAVTAASPSIASVVAVALPVRLGADVTLPSRPSVDRARPQPEARHEARPGFRPGGRPRAVTPAGCERCHCTKGTGSETSALGSSDAGGRPAGPAVMSRSSHVVTSSVRVIRSPTVAAGAMTATRGARGANMWPAGR
jgi:hypothetical protein